MILTSEKRNKSDALAETLKGLTINNTGYDESKSANANEAKGDPASNPKVANHTSDRKKRKVKNTRNRDLQKKLLSNWNLPIIPTTIDPQIDDGIATCEGTHHTLLKLTMKEVIADAARGLSELLGM